MHSDRLDSAGSKLDAKLIDWRRDFLLAVGFPSSLAHQQASDSRIDLHELADLVGRGCSPELAVRILAPLEDTDR